MMAHSDKGCYAGKHQPGGSPDEKIAVGIRLRVQEGTLTCSDAERISAGLEVEMAEVGRTLDLLEIRIGHCQLGLFGYPPDGKIVRAEEWTEPVLGEMIRNRLSGGRLSCAAAWKIAVVLAVPRMKVSSACESLGIRIKPCQLGAF
jgi:hypothetical protein